MPADLQRVEEPATSPPTIAATRPSPTPPIAKSKYAVWKWLALGLVAVAVGNFIRNQGRQDTDKLGALKRVHAAQNDLEALQGTWELIYFERDGKEVKLKDKTRTINSGNKFVIQRGDQVIAAGTMKLDPSKKPGASEATYSEGPDKGKTFKGIYEFDGDKVKFCRAGSPDDARPTEFKTKPGSGQFVSVYQRARPGGSRPGK